MTFFDQAVESFCLPAETEWVATPDGHMNESWTGSCNGQPKYVLRLYHSDRTPLNLQDEHKILTVIAPHLPVGVPEPITSKTGDTFVDHEDQLVSVFGYLPGRHPDFTVPGAVETAAEVLAACHGGLWSVREQLAWSTKTRAPLSPEVWPHPTELHQKLAHASVEVPKELLTKVIQRAGASLENLDEIHTTAHVIHGDVNASNLLIIGEAVTALLDWDECRWDLPIYDLCSLLNCIDQDSLRADALKAYQKTISGTEHPYANEMPKILELLPAAQTVSVFNELLTMLCSERHQPGYLEKLLHELGHSDPETDFP